MALTRLATSVPVGHLGALLAEGDVGRDHAGGAFERLLDDVGARRARHVAHRQHHGARGRRLMQRRASRGRYDGRSAGGASAAASESGLLGPPVQAERCLFRHDVAVGRSCACVDHDHLPVFSGCHQAQVCRNYRLKRFFSSPRNRQHTLRCRHAGGRRTLGRVGLRAPDSGALGILCSTGPSDRAGRRVSPRSFCERLARRAGKLKASRVTGARP